jgi:hypothetical protein
MAGLLDLITGGANENAANDLQQALQNVESVSTPSAAQLQLGPLDQYALTGELTPAQMEAAAAGPSAYENENISQVPIADMQQALSQEQEIANAQGETPQEQAAIESGFNGLDK